MLAKKSFEDFKKWFDYSNYGGSPLLGVNGGVIISHGRSSSKAIKNAIRVAAEMIRSRVNGHIVQLLSEFDQEQMNEGQESSDTDQKPGESE